VVVSDLLALLKPSKTGFHMSTLTTGDDGEVQSEAEESEEMLAEKVQEGSMFV